MFNSQITFIDEKVIELISLNSLKQQINIFKSKAFEIPWNPLKTLESFWNSLEKQKQCRRDFRDTPLFLKKDYIVFF